MNKILISALIIAAAFLWGCGSTTSNPYDTTTTATSSGTTTTAQGGGVTAAVTIVDFAFSPATLTISPETTVTWTNTGAAPHTATSTAGPLSFDSGVLGTGGTYSFKFTTLGTYDYVCSIHLFAGQIIVR